MHTQTFGSIRSGYRFYIPVSAVIAAFRTAYWPLRLASQVMAWHENRAKKVPMLPWPADLFDDVMPEHQAP